MKLRLYYIFALIMTLSLSSVLAQDFYMVPNEGQWEGSFDYKIKMNAGAMFLQSDGMRFTLTDLMEKMHHSDHGHEDVEEYWTSNVFMTWQGANINAQSTSSKKAKFYYNYFLGNNPSNWKSKIYPASYVRYKDVYDKIDVEYLTTPSGLKYNYIIKKDADYDKIKWKWEGAESIKVRGGQLIIATKIGEIIESTPHSFIYDNGSKKEVNIGYKELPNGNFTFDFSAIEYIHFDSVVIDPVLTFSTYSGSTEDNWGTTACPDNNDNAIGGGITFGAGYPTTSGAFQTSFQGGTGGQSNPFDMSVTKFTKDGTALLYATYIGGSSGNEIPCSMIVDGNNNLFIYGVTGSDDFPISSNAYQSNFEGGPASIQNNLRFEGSDIVVFQLTPDGTGMNASTYVGGSGLDGLNISQSALAKNYGDQFRGEINFDGSGNVVVASTTRSSDFPMANSFDNSLGGVQDGVFFKLSANLGSLLHSSYVGGDDYDALYGVKSDQSGNVFVVGGTMSSNLLNTSNTYQPAIAGDQDGFVGKIVNNSLNAITYLGTSQYDQAYFVDIDPDDFVYVFGQTDGNYTISPGVYDNSGGGQFIQKLDNNLQNSIWSTKVGGVNNGPQISPTAFLVSDCYEIYIAGWGGQTNGDVTSSTTQNFPVSSNAYQTSTNGSNFYIALYEPDMAALEYATFMGGISSSFNHVDGGTSRFDKRGIIYHSVCASCGNNNDGFTSTPGVYSPTSQSSNCNMAVFKFDLSEVLVDFAISDDNVCKDDIVTFTNLSTTGLVYEWDFGDGSTSSIYSPSHSYSNPGIYDVSLVVHDTVSCYIPDTLETQITVSDPIIEIEVLPNDSVCPGTQVEFFVNGIFNGTYNWSISKGVLSNTTIPNPISIIDSSLYVAVEVNTACGLGYDTLDMFVFSYSPEAGTDTAICLGGSAQLSVDIGSSWEWSPAADLNNPSLQNPMASPQQDTEYIVEVTTGEGCVLNDTVLVEVDQDIPLPILPDTLHMCSGSSKVLNASDARSYFWYPNYEITDVSLQSVTVSPANDTMYYVDLFNACGQNTDSSYIDVIFPDITASNDTIICPGRSVHLYAFDAETYSWTPTSSLVGENTNHVIAAPEVSTSYIVAGTDQYGCIAYDTVTVKLFPKPTIQVSPDYYGFVGDTVQLSATGSPGVYQWSPTSYLSCEFCTEPYAVPPANQTYNVTVTDSSGCKVSDQVSIYFDPILYVPNAFTPNDDGFNQTFGAEGGNITEFTMYIFNRWGELIFEAHDMKTRWNGTYEGQESPMDVYVWKIFYTDMNDIKRELYGHVTLIR